MNRCKKPKKNMCHCSNCGYDTMISPDTVKEKTFDMEIATRIERPVIATYVECPVCGERILKQLDTEKTMALAKHGVKLQLMQKQGKKLSDKQKSRLKRIESHLFNTRKNLNLLYWDEIYQSLNPVEEDKTGTADH